MSAVGGIDPLIGRSFGNYKLTRQIGEGGMGTVYLAEHPLIGKRVALKVLHPDLARDEDIVSRFFTEARAVCRIGHEHIVDIIDFGKTAELTYFIMEYLEGEPLSGAMQREGALPQARSMRVAGQTASALAASHKLGIVHRDLKPENIFLTRRGADNDFVKVLDFGIAKLTGDAASSSSHRTRAGVLLGTPYYMSPEQCEGRREVDHRADIYSLGVILYEMLTGKVPFGGDAVAAVLAQHLTAKPAPPTELKADIAPALEEVVLKCLEKAPGDRYANMDELAAALQRAATAPAAVGPKAKPRPEAPPAREPMKTIVDGVDVESAPTRPADDDDAEGPTNAVDGPDASALKTQMFVPEEATSGSGKNAISRGTPAPVETSGAPDPAQLKTKLLTDERLPSATPAPAKGASGGTGKSALPPPSGAGSGGTPKPNVAEMKTMLFSEAAHGGAGAAAASEPESQKDDGESGENVKTVMYDGSGPGARPAAAGTPVPRAAPAPPPQGVPATTSQMSAAAAAQAAPPRSGGGGAGAIILVAVLVALAVSGAGAAYYLGYIPDVFGLGIGAGAADDDEGADDADEPVKKKTKKDEADDEGKDDRAAKDDHAAKDDDTAAPRPKDTAAPATSEPKPKATAAPATADTKPKPTAAPATAAPKPKATAAPASAKPKTAASGTAAASAKPKTAAGGTAAAKGTAGPKSGKPHPKDEILSPF